MDPDHPADTLLRRVLREAPNVSSALGKEVAAAVFAYYRWYGWRDPETPLAGQIRRALDRDRQFQSDPEFFSMDELLARAVPAWLGREMPVTGAFVKSLQGKPALWIRARAGLGAAIASELGDCQRPFASQMPDALRYCGSLDLFRSASFQKGEIELQDLSSQLVGIMAEPRPGQTWWDACAGEGGKMLHLSDLMGNRGLLWATDRSPRRLAVLARRGARAHCFNYRARLWTGGPGLPVKTKFDGILLDAPCSGIGTWQRNPHARWTTTPRDVRELAELQRRLFRAVVPALKPGGKIIYAVCTMTRSETVEFCQEMDKIESIEPWPLKNPLRPELPANARHFFWPQETGANGMFVAGWKKR